MTPEQQGKALAEAILKQMQEEIDKLSEYLISQGKLPHEYVLVENRQEVLDGFDRGVNIPYEVKAIPKLALNTLINSKGEIV